MTYKKRPCTARLHETTGGYSVTWLIASRRRPAAHSNPPADGGVRTRHNATVRATRIVNEIVHDCDLRYMWTLTLRRDPTYEDVIRELSRFSQRLRRTGLACPRVAVPERGALTRRWHVHLAVPVRLTPEEMDVLWTAGDVTVPDEFEAGTPAALEEISGYLTKSFESSEPGRRRYLPAGGAKPVATRFNVSSMDEAFARATRVFGAPPLWVCNSSGGCYAGFPPLRASR